MKTVRVNMDTFVKMMRVKHEQELIKMDVVNMSDVSDVIMWRYEKLVESLREENEEALDEILNTKFIFTDAADKPAMPQGEADEDEDEDEDEDPEERVVPKPRRKAATRKKTTRKRRPRPAEEDE